MKRNFFSEKGLQRFKVNMANNVCHISANSESACWLTLSAVLSGAKDSAINRLFIICVENLYKNPAIFDEKYTHTEQLPLEFKGLRDLFFIYFIRRIPIMLKGTQLSWHHPKSPSKSEIVEICDYCIDQYAQDWQTTNTNLISRFRECYEVGFKWTGALHSRHSKDQFYYDTDILENFMLESLEAFLDLKYPTSIRNKSDQMQRTYEHQINRFQHYLVWFRANKHVFIDRLADHLQIAYPIYKSDVW